jgi:cold shock CspA family protein
MAVGTVRFYNRLHGYGIVTSGDRDHYIPANAIRHLPEPLRGGERIEFSPQQTIQGWRATNVKVLD